MPSLGDSGDFGHGSGKRYWRSLDELSGSPEFEAFVAREFPYLDRAMAASSTRRHFLKVMGASLALAGLTGCRWPQEKIVEYARRPRGRVPGEPVQFATAFERDGVATGYLVTSCDGRPIKIDGNPLHPFSYGATDAIAQAAILEMYDPDRSRLPRVTGIKSLPARIWDDFRVMLASLGTDARAAQGDWLAILAQPSSSPTRIDLRERLAKAMPKAGWYEYAPLARENEQLGLALAMGKPHRAQLNFRDADIIASFDCDFLLTHPAALRYTRDFARNRTAFDWEGGKPSDRMSRLHVIESGLSLTGSNADERYAERCGDVAMRLCQLAAELMKKGLALPGSAAAAKAVLEKFDAASKQPKYLEEIAADLLASKGRSLIVVGARQPVEAHALAALLNAALENGGKTVSYTESPAATRGIDSIAALVEGMNNGGVKSLVILGGNPAYDAPSDVAFAGALEKFKGTSVHVSLYEDETSKLCTWHAPLAHDLESWGDARAWDGTVSVQQPLIDPLYNGISAIETIATILGDETARGYELVRRTFRAKFAGGLDFEAAWRDALHDGVVKKTAFEARPGAITLADWAKPMDDLRGRWAPADGKSFEVVFAQDYKVYDGRFVNNAWLQELPDPITKLTWDNAALISPADAARLRIRRDDKIEISLGGAKLVIPVCVVPGHAPTSITLPIGYGRTAAGKVAEGSGFNVNVIRRRGGFDVAAGAMVSVAGGSYELATTQDHHAMDTAVGRTETQRRVPELAREGTLEQYKKTRHKVAEAGHKLPLVQMFGDFEATYTKGPRWAMAIDLSKCTGCSACVVACQAENNIPVVGKHEVRLGREMHWMRIDRYFIGDPADPQVIHQPVACQHCENAPCEQVCPVAATVHDEQGLNVMVYNRCIGTRYCSNNCPYKVRRFNWFFNHHGPRHPRSRQGGETVFQTFDIKNTPNMLPETKLTPVEQMVFNPDVTVRSRGVMEKCTFCVQRLTKAKIEARNEQVSPRPGQSASGDIADGTVQTACQQVCPAEAIVFGDLNVKGSAVNRWHAHDRSYVLLEEINARPRNKYLAKLRNPKHEPPPKDAHGGHGGHS